MRINLITCPFGGLPPHALGAVEKLFYQLAGEWVKADHEVCFVCTDGGNNERMKFVRLGGYKRTGKILTDLPFDFWYSIKALLAMPKCDVLVCNTFWSPFLAPLVRWKYKKLVYGVHRYPKGQFWLYRFVDSFICVSTAIGEAVKSQCSAVASRVSVICNPYDAAVFNPKPRLHNDSEIVILYSGRIAVEKGIVHLAKAVREVAKDQTVINGRKVRLVLVGTWQTESGGGGDAYRQEILDAFDSAEFVGPVFEAERLANLIRRADIYCYPTIAEHGEAMPVAPLEAMACGVPVVLPRFKCFADYARDGENCLMYDEPDNLSLVLKRLVVDKRLSEMIAANGEKAVDEFTISKVAQRYIQVLVQ